MNNKEKYDIYNAFDSLTVPDEITKQKIFNSIIKKERKRNISFRNFAVPAAAVLMVAVNTGLIYNAATANPQPPNINKNDGNIYTETVIRASADISDTMTTKTSDYIIYNAASGTAASMENILYSETTLPAMTTPEIIISSETYIVTTPYIPETTVSVATITAPAETSVPQTEKIQGTLLPPVSDDLQNLFSEAYQIYKEFSLGGNMFCLDFDENNDYSAEKNVTIDGNVYSLTSQKYFTTMQDVYDYYHQYFTDDYINRTAILSKFMEYEGRVYTNTGAKGGIIGYSGHIYDIVSQSDNEIDIKATCYIINDTTNMTDSLFFCEPDNPDDYDTIERDIVFRKENDVWLIDNISLMW